MRFSSLLCCGGNELQGLLCTYSYDIIKCSLLHSLIIQLDIALCRQHMATVFTSHTTACLLVLYCWRCSGQIRTHLQVDMSSSARSDAVYVVPVLGQPAVN